MNRKIAENSRCKRIRKLRKEANKVNIFNKKILSNEELITTYLDNRYIGTIKIEANMKKLQFAYALKEDLIKNATIYENHFKLFLDVIKLPYEFQHIIIIGKDRTIDTCYVGDFYIPKLNVIIELDGSYHYESDQIDRDKLRDSLINKKGYHILRFKNKEIYNLEYVINCFNKYLGFNKRYDIPTLRKRLGEEMVKKAA